MMYKTWFIHIAHSILKLLNWTFGTANWLIEPKTTCESLDVELRQSLTDGDCLLDSYNEEFVANTRPVVLKAIISLIIASLVLDIAIYKWRNLIHFCIVIDLFHVALWNMITLTSATSTLLDTFVVIALCIIAFYSGPGWQIIAALVAEAFQMFFIQGFVY